VVREPAPDEEECTHQRIRAVNRQSSVVNRLRRRRVEGRRSTSGDAQTRLPVDD
jgi:hypothetical protein